MVIPGALVEVQVQAEEVDEPIHTGYDMAHVVWGNRPRCWILTRDRAGFAGREVHTGRGCNKDMGRRRKWDLGVALEEYMGRSIVLLGTQAWTPDQDVVSHRRMDQEPQVHRDLRT